MVDKCESRSLKEITGLVHEKLREFKFEPISRAGWYSVNNHIRTINKCHCKDFVRLDNYYLRVFNTCCVELLGSTRKVFIGEFNAISEIGAWDLSNLILSISNQNTSLSKLDDKTIRKRAYAITETAVRMMISNWVSYKITNRAQLAYIADIVYGLSLITLKMADAEGIRKMITGMYSESRNISEFDSPKKKMFRGRI